MRRSFGPTARNIAPADCAFERCPRPPEIRFFKRPSVWPVAEHVLVVVHLDAAASSPGAGSPRSASSARPRSEAMTRRASSDSKEYATDSAASCGVANARKPSSPIRPSRAGWMRTKGVKRSPSRPIADGRAGGRVDRAVPAPDEDRGAARVVVVLVGQEERRRSSRRSIPRASMRRSISARRGRRPRAPASARTRRHRRCRRSRTRGP